jgi:VWFA-related protein
MPMILSRSVRTVRYLSAAIIVSFTAIYSPGSAQEKQSVEVITINTDLVVFDLQVLDKKTKRAVGDLKKDDFAVIENGVRQPVSYLSRDELPLSIILLIDVSGSVRPILHRIRDGALRALQRLKPDDQVAVMAFADTSKLAHDFTRDRGLVARTIEEETATGVLGTGTLLGPALESAAMHMRQAPTQISRRVIIVVTDNVALTFPPQQKKTLQELFDSGSVVYGLRVCCGSGSLFPYLGMGATRGVNEYVEQTGGELLDADNNKVDEKLALVIDRLRSRYAIGFKPANTSEDGRFRRVEIMITSPKKKGEQAVVLTKRGYYFRRR